MPTYEYRCASCSHEFEKVQSIKEDPEKRCPRCERKDAKRLISRTSFTLKGSGWAAQGYGS